MDKHVTKKHSEIRFLLELLKPYSLRVFFFLFGSLFISLFDGISIGLLIPILRIWQGTPAEASLPSFFDSLVDQFQSSTVPGHLILLVGIVITAILLKNLLLSITVSQGLKLSNQAAADTRLRAMDVLLSVDLKYHHEEKSGNLLEKTINHIDVVKDIITSIAEIIVYGLISLILLGMMFLISWQLTIISILLCAVLMGFLYLYTRHLSRLGARTAESRSDMTHTIQENLNAVRLIRSYNRKTRQLQILKGKIIGYANAEIRSMSRVHWITPLSESIGAFGIGLLLILSWLFIPTNDFLPLANLLPFFYILLRNVQNLRYINNQQGNIRANWPFLSQIHELVQTDNKPFIQDGKVEFSGLSREIVFDNVAFAYGERLVLDRADFSIQRGRVTAVIGESGAGKSTIVNLIMRFYDPAEGEILVDGRTLKDYRIASFREKIGIVSQDTFIFNQSVYENIGFALDSDVIPRELVIEAARKADAHEFIMKLPQGYDTQLGDQGVILSGGQKQRISIARAILKDPEILILDEATSSLDTLTERSVHQAIIDLQQDRTTIIIAHRFSSLRPADYLIVLKNGKVVEKGNPQDLRRLKNEFYKLERVK